MDDADGEPIKPQDHDELRHSSPRLVGAAAALAVGVGFLAVLAGLSPFGFDASPLFVQPQFIAVCLALSVALGWRLGGRVTSGGWRSVALSGVAFGIVWPPMAILVLFGVATIDASARGVFTASDVGPGAAYLVYGLAIFWIYGAVIFIPLGIVWAVTARVAARISGLRHRPRRDPRASNAGFVLALAVITGAGGAAQTLAYAPWNTNCLRFPGESATAAAFSPAGDRLAVALRSDTYESGVVLLLDWPSGRTLATWPAATDLAVAVSPDGRVYWSSGDFAGDAPILTAIAGSAPSELVVATNNSIGDLTWTRAGLAGLTSDGSFIASISLAGAPAMLALRPAPGDLREFWASSDGTISASETWQSSTIEVVGPAGSPSVPVSGGAEGFALTNDQRTLVVAATAGGIRTVDVATGHSRQIMPGNQSFIAMSDYGNLAWTNDGEFGRGPLCTSTLARLGG